VHTVRVKAIFKEFLNMDTKFVSGIWPVGTALEWYVSGNGQAISIDPMSGIYEDLKLNTLVNDFQEVFEQITVGSSFGFGGGFGGAHAESINHADVFVTVSNVFAVNDGLKFVEFSIDGVTDTYDFNLDRLGPDLVSGKWGNMLRHGATLAGALMASAMAKQNAMAGEFNSPQEYSITIGPAPGSFKLMVPRPNSSPAPVSLFEAASRAGGNFANNVNNGIAQMVQATVPGSNLSLLLNECFPSGTIVSLHDGSVLPIKTIKVGDIVASYSNDETGRGELTGKRVIRLFENITDTWIELSNGLTVTPGHRLLAPDGSFRSVEDILAADGIVIDENGHELEVTGEYIRYSEETADLYEQAEIFVAQTAGATALEPELKKGWKTYNFEVEEFHTFEPANTNNLPINKQKTAA